jgi:hypothetical protein
MTFTLRCWFLHTAVQIRKNSVNNDWDPEIRFLSAHQLEGERRPCGWVSVYASDTP